MNLLRNLMLRNLVKLTAAFCILASLACAQALRIYHIDVEQASATLLVAPDGRTLLVDSGKNGHGSRIRAVMNAAGVSQINFFVNTHYHEDHYGGIDDLVALGVPVLQSYDRGDKSHLPASKLSEPTYRSYQSAVGEDAIHLQRGETIPLDPSMNVTCISSGGVVISENPAVPGHDENDMSLSLLITFGAFRYFIGGDIENYTEAKIATRDLVRNVHVYVADHHGSDTSSSQAFMRDLAPQVIVVSNGNNGTYKHPRKVTLDFYRTLPSPPLVYQTNKYLQGLPGSNVADQFIADPQTVDQDGTILISVDPAGTYTVSYGATAQQLTYGAAPAPGVVIQSLLPNPAGDDAIREEVTLRNRGSSAVSLAGWKLRDRSGLTWPLTGAGTIAAGQARTILRNGMAMTLNNAGDEIALLDAGNVVRAQFAYANSSEGVRIQTGQ